MGKIRVLRACARAWGYAGVLVVMASGCGGDDASGGAGNQPDAPDLTGRDQADNGVIAVDEQALRGEVSGGEIALDIPVRVVASSGEARGTLEVSLRSVDDARTLDAVSVGYVLAAGDAEMLRARLPMPAGVKDEADLVEFNVRIEQAGSRPLHVTRSLLHVLPLYEVRLEGPSKLRADKLASYRALMLDPRTRAPRQDETVELFLRKDDQVVHTLRETTDEAGVAIFEVEVEEAGEYEVQARGTTQGTSVELSQGIAVEQPGEKVLLTTDKPIYQPGQTIHLRALALQNPGNQPIGEREVVFEVEDGKGNKIMKRTLSTDDHGIASTRFAIGQIVNMGAFKVRATAGAVVAERTVQVSRYALPKFDVELAVDRGFYTPGQVVTGTLSARYFFGKDVAGASVTLEAATLDVGENVFERVMGMTDANGDMDFSVQLPSTLAGIPLQDGNALVTLRAVVADTADQEVRKELALTVAASAVRLALVPESTALVPGVENRLHLFATDPLGGPVAAAPVEVTPQGGSAVSAETDPFGHVEVRWTPGAGATRVHVELQPTGLPEVREDFDFSTQSGGEHVLVRTDKSIYAIGENVRVELFTSADESVVYVDWINDGQAVDMRTLDVEDGRASFDMALDTNLLGDNRIEAYVVDGDGNIVRAGRSIVVKGDAALSVSLSTDKAVYAPGEPAELTFTVVDEQGEPTVAALGVQIVDEAVFSLIDARPGLLKTYFELEDAFAEPSYEIKGPIASFEQLLFSDTAPGADPEAAEAAQLRAEGSLAALTGRAMMGIAQSTWPLTVEAARKLLVDPLAAEKSRLLALLGPIATRELKELVAEGCRLDQYYCEAAGTSVAEALVERLRGAVTAYDLWGVAYRATEPMNWLALRYASAGPDEVVGNLDDEALEISLSELEVAVGEAGGEADAGVNFDQGGGFPRGPDDGNFGAAGTGAAPGQPVPMEGPSDPTTGEPGEQEAGPRVRSEFPETLYVNPAIITGADGKATIGIDMADSITEWRVSALANAQSGKLGGGEAGITVFQDFFSDLNFPAELTRGDEVEFPIVVYNYLGEAQSVRLELEPADWYTALGSTELTLDLQPGEVRASRLPVRVERVGVQTLTVRAFGGAASDAVARMVRVVPDGQAVPLAQSGSLAPGGLTLSVDFPIDAVLGSEQLYLEVYPAFLSHAVSGLDSMLQVPDGCFEQTTSTTWPNVLVTHYMEQTGQTTPEIQLKAESLISAGYQRLLTFEHPGGGFSWFGTQDPAPFLSVTAFGLMEFADMAAVHEVDPDMVARTQSWLLAQQQADGSWIGDMSEFFSFHTSAVRNSAFVAWALAQNGYEGAEMERALAYLKANLADDADAYTRALVANAFALAAPQDAFGMELLQQLDADKSVAGDKASWDSGETQTNFYSAGDDAAIATTALVAHAMLIAGGYGDTVVAALNYLVGSKDPMGNFGSTQSTVWTLKTLLLSALRGTEGAVGTLEVALDGAPFASVELSEDQMDVMTTVDMSELATTGAHAVTLTFAGEGKVSYNLVSKHHVPWQPGQTSAGPLAISVEYDRTSLVVEETVTATLTVANQTPSPQNMILVTAGLPPGFELLGEDLDAHVQSGALSHWEKTGKQLILYLTELGASESRAFDYRLRASMPVRAVDGGAEAYLYYEPEQRAQSAGQLLAASAQ